MDGTTGKRFMQIADVLTSKGYSVGQQLGQGTYSKVRTAERFSDGKMCAVKIVDLNKARKDYLKKFMPRELEILPKLKHDNVINIFEIIQTHDLVFQVMQYAEQGDVLQMIQRNTVIPEDKCKTIFIDIANGVSYMHSINVAHRDLKCENILIFQNNHAVIGDFGFACTFDTDSNDINCKTFCGSTAYASPELVQGIPYDPRCNDVWSMGVILFTMLCGAMPFDDANVTRMVEKQKSRKFSYHSRVADKVSQLAKDTVYTILNPDPATRPTVANVLECEWIKYNPTVTVS